MGGVSRSAFKESKKKRRKKKRPLNHRKKLGPKSNFRKK